MARAIIMPRQGNTVESCVIVRWKAAEGDSVAAGAAVCEVETDKASFDVVAGEAGVLLKILRPEGDDVPVLEPIAVVGAKGEDWASALAGFAGPAGTVTGSAPGSAARLAADAAPGLPAAATRAEPRGVSPAGDPAGVSPRARHLAAEAGVDAASLPGSGPGGRVIERDVKAALADRPPLTAAALAAVSAGAGVPAFGSALGGRVGLEDLSAALSTPAGQTAPPASDFPGPFADQTVKGVRKLIAERMRASLANHAQLTLNASAPAARMLELRARFKESDTALGLTNVTLGDLVLFAASRVLPRFPYMNAHNAGGTLRTFDKVHLGLAVDTPKGLMVPVIRDAGRFTLSGLSTESKRLAMACQSGTVMPDELSGSTFTITNLGAFGIESFTPVLNSPEVGILGVCSIAQRPIPGPDGSVILEPRMGLSLTIDHQAVDGAPAARFLEALLEALADIDLLLAK